MRTNATHYARSALRWLMAGVGLAAASYATYAVVTWFRYGHPAHPPSPEEGDSLLDRFMPVFEVAERYHVRVAAPAQITLAAASDMDLRQSAIVRGIFKSRELILGSKPDDTQRPRALLAQAKALGWGVLAETPGRVIVFGAFTRPWAANVVFQALSPEEFASFDQPGYVKIVWTVRADPIGLTESIFRTETRAATTSPMARARFRRYWSFFSPGIVLIRRISVGLVKTEAERRAREAGPRASAAPRGDPAGIFKSQSIPRTERRLAPRSVMPRGR